MKDLTWVLEFWKDSKTMSKTQLMEKYAGEIPYEELMERFINLYIENKKLKDRIDLAEKVLSGKEI